MVCVWVCVWVTVWSWSCEEAWATKVVTWSWWLDFLDLTSVYLLWSSVVWPRVQWVAVWWDYWPDWSVTWKVPVGWTWWTVVVVWNTSWGCWPWNLDLLGGGTGGGA